MRQRARIGRAAFLVPVLFAVAVPACTNYYKVTDTTSGRTFYTTNVDRDRRTAAIQFKDARSGAAITLPSSEVLEIKKDEYNTAVGKQ